ncbi:spermidine synthase [Legionella bononiensis]|uniref:Fused MFS/spermidine synthase n=1 Tax=Legionella bononiensis TaxID=2793102 RepID=A0ABS1WCJ7_9GAMM|nr:fused MFS/spermidine synthase [Legionella bononiensis]MBL7478940.1 fused MFS/spermidine synthase [Legionella bononiensis]MBL7527072.1 fused MFS/spermidine synthase [Legionella bononiensis]MBL7562041.1 fused MFS/spermidine synthase [Legionella bononiensis]
MWKTKLGQCIYTSPSGYKVFQNSIYRWLTLGSEALQTVINRRKPQNPILHYLPALTLMARNYPDNCCLFGLGGAGIPHMLKTITPNQSITAVECSEEVIQISKSYFMVNQLPKLEIIHQNASEFVQSTSLLYKHLIVDLYDAHNFPKECTTDNFFISCHNRLTEDGFLAVNLANYKEQWELVQTIKKQFNTAIVIPIKHCANLVLVAAKNPNKEVFIEQINATGEMKNISWTQSWGTLGEY